MGKLKPPLKVTLICGILVSKDWIENKFNISSHSDIVQKINSQLQSLFSPSGFTIESNSEIINFDFTDYYTNEMGKEILRYWISFTPLVSPEQLWKIKIFTNKLEQENFTDKSGNRKLNLDPGYIEGSKLVLFSTKNFAHRIYLAEGIYAEVTLVYKHGKFEFLAWTYPDYKTVQAINFFSFIRDNWVKKTSLNNTKEII